MSLPDASRVLEAAGDLVPLPPDCVAPLVGCSSLSALDKMRCIGRGPRFVRIGRRVHYPAGEVRRYLAGLARHQVA